MPSSPSFFATSKHSLPLPKTYSLKIIFGVKNFDKASSNFFRSKSGLSLTSSPSAKISKTTYEKLFLPLLTLSCSIEKSLRPFLSKTTTSPSKIATLSPSESSKSSAITANFFVKSLPFLDLSFTLPFSMYENTL